MSAFEECLNIGAKTAAKLIQVGIDSPAKLRELGSRQTFSFSTSTTREPDSIPFTPWKVRYRGFGGMTWTPGIKKI